MYITSLVMDGFKSYNEAEEIDGFDEKFNEITELNEITKSNLLDALSFVFGITKLDQISDDEKSSLIYEYGKAGKKTASVSVTLDNSNSAKSPSGYQLFDEITITRQIELNGLSKYMFDGTEYTEKSIHNLYFSSKLDINNPYFFITQDSVKKILNMQPVEILSVIEKIAGVDKSMWQEREATARKLITEAYQRLNILENRFVHAQLVVYEIAKEKETSIKLLRIYDLIDDCCNIINAHEDYLKANKSIEETGTEIEELSKVLDKQGENAELDKLKNQLKDYESRILVNNQNFNKTDIYHFILNKLKEVKQKKLELESERNNLVQDIISLRTPDFITRVEHYKRLKFLIRDIKKNIEKYHEIINNLETDKKIMFSEVYEKINGYFKSIIQSLLLSLESANLEQTVDGLKIKVKFPNEEDKSLADLSGCEKSLVALAFILAILKHKPSPIYIIDEIDPDFDPSQTRNIGNVLEQNFDDSQFIIISCKEDMFTKGG